MSVCKAPPGLMMEQSLHAEGNCACAYRALVPSSGQCAAHCGNGFSQRAVKLLVLLSEIPCYFPSQAVGVAGFGSGLVGARVCELCARAPWYSVQFVKGNFGLP